MALVLDEHPTTTINKETAQYSTVQYSKAKHNPVIHNLIEPRLTS